MLAAAGLALLVTGCRQPAAAPPSAKPPPPEVSVSEAIVKEVQDYEEFPGRLDAVNSVEIRARVTGYLDKVHFKEGSIVNRNDVLLEIDPKPYEAEVRRAEGMVTQMEGRLKRLDADLQRAANLFGTKGLSREEYDKIAGDRTEAQGSLEASKADREKAKLNLNWTKVKAPLTGRVSRRWIDPGNLIKADDTILTTIVDFDPMYAYFDVDERTTLRFRRLVRDGVIQWSPEKGLPLQFGLVDETGFPWKGIINFADNRVDADTGTWRLRATVENPKHDLTPGLFINIRLPLGARFSAVLVAEQALGTDQGQKFLYVVGPGNIVEYRRVSVGRIHDGLRAITKGLAQGEKVVVSGLQRARPGVEVQPVVIPMGE